MRATPRFPGAMQRFFSAASQNRDRTRHRSLYGPGSAAHRKGAALRPGNGESRKILPRRHQLPGAMRTGAAKNPCLTGIFGVAQRLLTNWRVGFGRAARLV
jgi:hypothetical protein